MSLGLGLGRMMGSPATRIPANALRDRAGVPLRTRGGEFILTR